MKRESQPWVLHSYTSYIVVLCRHAAILHVACRMVGVYFVAADELYVALVTSSKANARLVSVDASAALAMPGVVGFLDHTCVPGSNVKGQEKEEIFATAEVCSV